MSESRITDAVADRAVMWFARLRADNVSTIDRDGFVRWLGQARSHQLAFIEVLDLWEELSVVKCLDVEDIRSFVLIRGEKEKLSSGLVDLAS